MRLAMADVFVSYSRRDKEFVRVLHDALTKSHYNTWIDWEDIPPTADWWAEIKAGIEETHTFIVVITSESVASRVCRDEIDHAVLHSKRIIPVVRQSDFLREDLHPALAHLQWLFFQADDKFDVAFQALVEAINTDLEYKKTHTRWQVSALKWEKQGRDANLLMRGRELDEAEQWLIQSSSRQEPPPTKLQSEFIAASRKASTRQQRRLVGLLSLLLFLACVSSFASWQWNRTRKLLITEIELRQELEVALKREQALRQELEAALERERQALADAASQRQLAEKQRDLAEQRRQEAEAARTLAEQQQQAAEEARQQAESAFEQLDQARSEVEKATEATELANRQRQESEAAAARQQQEIELLQQEVERLQYEAAPSR